MARRRIQKRKNISKRIKTRNKKSLISKKKLQIPQTNLWDKGLSFEENFKNIGIMTNINKAIDKAMNLNRSGPKITTENDVDVNEEISINNLDQGKIVLEPVEFHQKKLKMSIDDKHVIEKLVAKYKDDFKKMFKDIKINKFQWNPTQIKKAYDKYIKIYGDFPAK